MMPAAGGAPGFMALLRVAESSCAKYGIPRIKLYKQLPILPAPPTTIRRFSYPPREIETQIIFTGR